MKVKITKLSDDFFDGEHPNNINAGYTKIGGAKSKPVVGERFSVDSFSTSPVTEIIDDNTFKSTYSTYKIEYYED